MGRTRRSLPNTSLPSKATPRPAKAPAPKAELGDDLRARIAARHGQRAGTSGAGGTEDAGFSYAEFKRRRSASKEPAAMIDEDEDEDELLRHLGDDEDNDLLGMGAECDREAPAPAARAVAGGGGSSGTRATRRMGAETEREAPAGGGDSLGIRATRRTVLWISDLRLGE